MSKYIFGIFYKYTVRFFTLKHNIHPPPQKKNSLVIALVKTRFFVVFFCFFISSQNVKM